MTPDRPSPGPARPDAARPDAARPDAARPSAARPGASWKGAGWKGARREIAVATGLVAALAGATWVLLGPAAASIVVLFCAGLSLPALRALLPRQVTELSEPDAYYDTPSQSFTGFWRTQTDLSDATASMSAWDLNTRRRLQNLLAARLAERHGISLADDPQAAKAVFIGQNTSHKTGADLWYWIDPNRPTPPGAGSKPGIPPRVLAALIQRLEQL